MSVGAFLNLYGVCRLGEKFYKRNLERSGIVAKLQMLLASCDGILLPADAEITTLLTKISQKRNQLVHPKSHEFRIESLAHDIYPSDMPEIVGESHR